MKILRSKNEVLELYIIIIKCYIIIINAYYNYAINALCSYYISNKDLFEECDKEKNVDVAAVSTTSCLERGL
jgi:hypothetical protein